MAETLYDVSGPSDQTWLTVIRFSGVVGGNLGK